MKKILSLTLAVLLCFTAAAGLVSCGHEHDYSAEWSKDATHHWHDCADRECTEKGSKAEHTWNAGEQTAFAVTTYTCSVCSQTKTQNAKTTVTEAEFNAAFELGTNYTAILNATHPTQGDVVMTTKRQGNNYEKIQEMTSSQGNVKYTSYAEVSGGKIYTYSITSDNKYQKSESSMSVQEFDARTVEMFLPDFMCVYGNYTYDEQTGYYVDESVDNDGTQLNSLKLGFVDGKLVYICYTRLDGNNTVVYETEITYGDATVTLPSGDQLFVAPATTVTSEQWNAAFDLGDNFTVVCTQTSAGGTENWIDKRADNLTESGSFEDGEAGPTAETTQYGKIVGDQFYGYYPAHDGGDNFIGYHEELHEGTVEEALVELFGAYTLYGINDMADYTYNANDGVYERTEAEFMGFTATDIKVGFSDGKLVSVSYTIDIVLMELQVDARITYGDASITLPSSDQIVNG